MRSPSRLVGGIGLFDQDLILAAVPAARHLISLAHMQAERKVDVLVLQHVIGWRLQSCFALKPIVMAEAKDATGLGPIRPAAIRFSNYAIDRVIPAVQRHARLVVAGELRLRLFHVGQSVNPFAPTICRFRDGMRAGDTGR